MQHMIVLMFAAVLSVPFAFAEGSYPATERYLCDGGSFRAQVPVTWKRSDHAPPYADMTKVSGAKFVGPADADSIPATISLYYYSGEHAFTTPDSYVSARLSSMVREDAERGRQTVELQVAGRKATGFRMRTFELLTRPPEEPIPGREGDPRIYELAPVTKKVIMEEHYIVVPASRGYFVLQYRAPEGIAEADRPVFESVVRSFEPLIQ